MVELSFHWQNNMIGYFASAWNVGWEKQHLHQDGVHENGIHSEVGNDKRLVWWSVVVEHWSKRKPIESSMQLSIHYILNSIDIWFLVFGVKNEVNLLLPQLYNISIYTDIYRYRQIYTDIYRYIQIYTDIYRLYIYIYIYMHILFSY